MKKKWRRFEVLLPHRFNDGRLVPSAWLAEANNEIIARYGAVSFEQRQVEGRWRFEGKVYKDISARVIVDVFDTAQNRNWMKRFKARWKKKLDQLEIWMVSYRIQRE